MATLKSLLRKLACQTSTQCFPGGTDDRINISLTQETTQYVAPEDGWVTLEATGTDIQTELLGPVVQSLSNNHYGSWGRCYLPVCKGDSININIWGLSGATSHQAHFVPARGFV